MVCEKCQAANPQGAKFCMDCGAPLAAPVAANPAPAPPPVVAAWAVGAASSGTEEFWGPEPNYGKRPWVRIVALAFCVLITLAALASGRVSGPINTAFVMLMAVLATTIYVRLRLKPTKVYYTISPTGLSYRVDDGMEDIAWSEMEALEDIDGEAPALKLHWRGHREIEHVHKWFDRLMTRLTGKLYKGGLPYEEGATAPRSVTLNRGIKTLDGQAFGDRFPARFAQQATSAVRP